MRRVPKRSRHLYISENIYCAKLKEKRCFLQAKTFKNSSQKVKILNEQLIRIKKEGRKTITRLICHTDEQDRKGCSL